MSEPISNIVEEIDPDLLDQDSLFTFTIEDGSLVPNEWEVPTYLRNCFDLDLRRFVPNQEPMTLERFIEVAAQVIDDAQEREGIAADKRIRLIEDYPAEEFHRFGDTVVVWRLKSRRPADMSPSGSARQQKGFSYSYRYRTPKHPNMILEVESRPTDNDIEFAVWSKYARMANEKALWLERLFINHKWAFTIQGAERFQWTGRGIDTYQTTNGQRLYIRPLTFHVRLRDFRVKASPVIKQFQMDLESVRHDQFNNSSQIDSLA